MVEVAISYPTLASATLASEQAPDVASGVAASGLIKVFRDHHRDSRRPTFHPQAASGWASDPCGPIYYKGRYHMFFQHLHQSCQWYWGLCWDHVVSDDLVHWRKLPPAVVPTPGWYDADGCFSGAVEVDPETGAPVILYTGVYLRSNQEAVAALGLPPPEVEMPTRFVETLLAAVPANPDDPDLVVWSKATTPVMRYPPPNQPLTCWRDPFLFRDGQEWVMLLASGLRGTGGAILTFRSTSLTNGWRYCGVLAASHNRFNHMGTDWECPILAQLPDLAPNPSWEGDVAAAASPAGLDADSANSSGSDDSDLDTCTTDGCVIVVSTPGGLAGATAAGKADGLEAGSVSSLPPPLPHHAEVRPGQVGGAKLPLAALGEQGCDADMAADGDSESAEDGCSTGGSRPWFFCISPDACNNPIYYWLGSYHAATNSFDIDRAQGPFKVDLGRTLYAATLWTDPKGRQLLYGWIQEHRPVPPPPCQCDTYSYAGCVGVPRVLSLRDGQLYQQPLPEIVRLRNGPHVMLRDQLLQPGAPMLPLPGLEGGHLDLELVFLPPAGYEDVPAAIGAAAVGQQGSEGATSTSGTPANLRLSTDGTKDPPVTAPPELGAGADGGKGAAAVAAAATGQAPRVGLVLGSWQERGEGSCVVSFDWTTRVLQVEFDAALPNAYDPYPDDSLPDAKRVGGRLNNMRPGEPLVLRILLDGSALEIFTGSGEVLTTRVYRGRPSPGSPQAVAAAAVAPGGATLHIPGSAGIGLFAAGCAAGHLARLDAWQMGSCWTGVLHTSLLQAAADDA